MIPDLLRYFLTGHKAVEYSNATTTQLIDVREQLNGQRRSSQDWAFLDTSFQKSSRP
ncbi:MAG: hypothetical protein R2865_04330 [Deinococcales bacterium]